MTWTPRPAQGRRTAPAPPRRQARHPWVAPFGSLVPAPSYLAFNWAGSPTLVFSGAASGAIVNLPGGPYSAGATVIVTGQLLDQNGNGIPAVQLVSLTLTLVDTLTQQVVNNCLQANILNTGRGTVDSQGNLTIALGPADTSTSEAPGVPRLQRSAIVDWQYASGNTVSFGRQQGNLVLVALAGP